MFWLESANVANVVENNLFMLVLVTFRFLLVVVKVTNVMILVHFGLFVQMLRNLLEQPVLILCSNFRTI